MNSKVRTNQKSKQWGIVRLHGKDYFIDIELNQFRQVGNPHHFIDFDTEIGRQIWSACYMTTCPYCGIDTVLWAHEEGEQKVCSWCGVSSVVQHHRLCLVQQQ